MVLRHAGAYLGITGSFFLYNQGGLGNLIDRRLSEKYYFVMAACYFTKITKFSSVDITFRNGYRSMNLQSCLLMFLLAFSIIHSPLTLDFQREVRKGERATSTGNDKMKKKKKKKKKRKDGNLP